MINTIINAFIYSGFALLLFLGIKFIYELIKSRKQNYLKTVRLLLNFGILLTFCYGAFSTFAIVVIVPSEITNSKKQSLENLSRWILFEELKIGLIGLSLVLILGFVSYIFQRKFEKIELKKPIVNLTIINCILVLVSLLLIYAHTYSGLSLEIIRYFNTNNG